MLLQHLQELITYGVVEKTSYEGYPLRVEYYVSKRGEELVKAIEIMQRIGIEMMLEDGLSDILKKKGLL